MSDCDSLQTVAWVFAAAAVVFFGVGLFIDWHSRRLRASLAIVEQSAERASASWRLVGAADELGGAVRACLNDATENGLDDLAAALRAFDQAAEAERDRVLAEHTS